MRVALIGDVHANLPALRAVLEHARRHRAYEVWGAGDWVGAGDSPEEVVQLLQQRRVKAVLGNYDHSVLKVEARRAQWGSEGPPDNWKPVAWAYDRLSATSREHLRSLPPEMRLEAAGRRILVTHISPGVTEEPFSSATPVERLCELATLAAADVVIVAHTHAPLVRKVRGVWFINTGSVGRPRDGDSLACYAILTLGQKRVQVRHYRVPYEGSEQPAPAVPDQAHESGAAPIPSAPAIVAEKPAELAGGLGRKAARRNGRLAKAAVREGEQPVPPASAGAEPPVAETAADERLQAVLQLARSCEYEEGHTHQVTRVALRLFDELKLVHGLGPRERFWLQCGALLHDVGLIEGVQGHHKASLRIILESPILPFDKKERLVIGSIARYHRAALPQERHRHFAALKPGLRRTVRILAAMLRVADGLDYTHQSVVSDLACVLSPKQVVVRCTVKGPAEDERLRALEKGDLLAEVLERKLVVECQQS